MSFRPCFLPLPGIPEIPDVFDHASIYVERRRTEEDGVGVVVMRWQTECVVACPCRCLIKRHVLLKAVED